MGLRTTWKNRNTLERSRAGIFHAHPTGKLLAADSRKNSDRWNKDKSNVASEAFFPQKMLLVHSKAPGFIKKTKDKVLDD